MSPRKAVERAGAEHHVREAGAADLQRDAIDERVYRRHRAAQDVSLADADEAERIGRVERLAAGALQVRLLEQRPLDRRAHDDPVGDRLMHAIGEPDGAPRIGGQPREQHRQVVLRHPLPLHAEQHGADRVCDGAGAAALQLGQAAEEAVAVGQRDAGPLLRRHRGRDHGDEVEGGGAVLEHDAGLAAHQRSARLVLGQEQRAGDRPAHQAGDVVHALRVVDHLGDGHDRLVLVQPGQGLLAHAQHVPCVGLAAADREVPGQLQLLALPAGLGQRSEHVGLVALGQRRERRLAVGLAVAQAAEALGRRGRLAAGSHDAAQRDDVAAAVLELDQRMDDDGAALRVGRSADRRRRSAARASRPGPG